MKKYTQIVEMNLFMSIYNAEDTPNFIRRLKFSEQE